MSIVKNSHMNYQGAMGGIRIDLRGKAREMRACSAAGQRWHASAGAELETSGVDVLAWCRRV
jgi:hypothetical protein